MVLDSGKIKLTDWGGWRFRIGVVRLEGFLDVLDCVIIGIEEICGRCRSVDEVIGSIVLDILIDVLHLELH